ncbi:MAG: Tad domain-containing protein [Anaerolineales bacterium]|jgi:hypothetical protein
METINRKERGQILILLVLGIVVLLGFTALALDGGMIYSDRRLSQNASDASSLAGGGAAALSLENDYVNYNSWNCIKTLDNPVYVAMQEAVSAAIDQAADNDFVIDEDEADYNGVTAECTNVFNGVYWDRYIDVTTYISFTTDTSFIHFVYNGPVRNQVQAVTRVYPETEFSYGEAIVAHREDCPNSNTGGVHFDGNAEVTVNGGGVFSSACMRAGGSVDVDVNSGIVYTTDYHESGSPDIDPDPVDGDTVLPEHAYSIEAPDTACGELPDYGEHTGSGSISRGNFSKIRLNNGNLNMSPGLYCLSGNFTINGGELHGDGVTIYMTSGDFDSSGNATVQLSAPTVVTNTKQGIEGMLIYLGEDNTGSVSLLGSATSYYTGTVYAENPDSMIEIGGTGNQLDTFQTQLVGGTVFIHGNATIDINFNGSESYKPPTQLELYK